jgi:hypothetical protein
MITTKNKTETFYTLTLTDGSQLYLDKTSNDNGSCCGEYTHRLTKYNTGTTFKVNDLDSALFVKYNSTPWYNSEPENPQHSFEPEELLIVKTTLVIQEEIEPIEHIDYMNPELIRKFVRMVYGSPEYHNTQQNLADMADSYISGSCSMDKFTFGLYVKFAKAFHAADNIEVPYLLEFDDGQQLYISRHVINTALTVMKTNTADIVCLPTGIIRAVCGEKTIMLAENKKMVGSEKTVAKYSVK